MAAIQRPDEPFLDFIIRIQEEQNQERLALQLNQGNSGGKDSNSPSMQSIMDLVEQFSGGGSGNELLGNVEGGSSSLFDFGGVGSTGSGRTPGVALQFLDPFGDLLKGITDKHLGKDVSNFLDPIRFGIEKLGEMF